MIPRESWAPLREKSAVLSLDMNYGLRRSYCVVLGLEILCAEFFTICEDRNEFNEKGEQLGM